MLNNKYQLIHHPALLFLSLGGIGFISFAPGTIASLITTIALALAAPSRFFFPLLLWISLLLFLISWPIISFTQKAFHADDPSWIVMDEVIGVMLTWIIAQPKSPYEIFTIFVLFRLFDILKPWPISFADKKMNNALGVLLDDIIAGIFAGLLTILIFYTYARCQ